MFRIHFEPNGGFWCVQFERLGFFWVPVKAVAEGAAKPETIKFNSYDDAEAYIVEKGIDLIYRNRTGEPPALGQPVHVAPAEEPVIHRTRQRRMVAVSA